MAYDRYARDIIRDRFYRWIERAVVWITLAQSLVYFAAGFLIELSLGGDHRQGAAIRRQRMALGRHHQDRSGLAYHVVRKFLSPFVRLPQLRDQRQQPQQRSVAIITSGEGWHNNHHAEPGSASNQRRWWEIDLTYLLLRLLVLLGLAWDVQLPKRRVSPRARG